MKGVRVHNAKFQERFLSIQDKNLKIFISKLFTQLAARMKARIKFDFQSCPSDNGRETVMLGWISKDDTQTLTVRFTSGKYGGVEARIEHEDERSYVLYECPLEPTYRVGAEQGNERAFNFRVDIADYFDPIEIQDFVTELVKELSTWE